MRNKLIAEMKQELEERLREFLMNEGIDLHVAANDNVARGNPYIELETIDDMVLNGSNLLFEIRLVLGLLGKPWQCDALVRGIYYTLHPHNLTMAELAVLLMSIHVEHKSAGKEMQRNRVLLRYIVEVPGSGAPPQENRALRYIVEEC